MRCCVIKGSCTIQRTTSNNFTQTSFTHQAIDPVCARQFLLLACIVWIRQGLDLCRSVPILYLCIIWSVRVYCVYVHRMNDTRKDAGWTWIENRNSRGGIGVSGTLRMWCTKLEGRFWSILIYLDLNQSVPDGDKSWRDRRNPAWSRQITAWSRQETTETDFHVIEKSL